jgi:thioredoxin 1
MASEKVVHVTDANFDDEVIQHKGVVLVDFWAPWCGPCVAMSPVIDQVADEYDGKAKVCKLDTQDHPDLAVKYGVSAIPLLLVFRDGQVVKQEIGAKSLDAVKSMIDSAMA